VAIVYTADTCSGAEVKRKERPSGGTCICCVYNYDNYIVSQLPIKLKELRRVAKMIQSIIHIALVVKDYDEAIDFYTKKLHFTLLEDTYQPEQEKRWVVVSPPGSTGTNLLLAKASKPEQESFIGNQTGGRVFLFLNTDDFWRDYNEMVANGIEFVREPKEQSYGLVAVFKDLYGNLWDLLELNADHPIMERMK
jgi:catechol 2,3-dioxygenase-like lactoylglutathione lyase family enzyme